MTPQEIQALIKAHITDAEVTVTGSEGKYKAIVVTDRFAGLDKVSRHQAVYAAVTEHITSGKIHALSIASYTTDEYRQAEEA